MVVFADTVNAFAIRFASPRVCVKTQRRVLHGLQKTTNNGHGVTKTNGMDEGRKTRCEQHTRAYGLVWPSRKRNAIVFDYSS